MKIFLVLDNLMTKTKKRALQLQVTRIRSAFDGFETHPSLPYLECDGHSGVVDGGELELEVVGVFGGGGLVVGDCDALRGHDLAGGVGDDVCGDLVKDLRGVRDRALRQDLSRKDVRLQRKVVISKVLGGNINTEIVTT